MTAQTAKILVLFLFVGTLVSAGGNKSNNSKNDNQNKPKKNRSKFPIGCMSKKKKKQSQNKHELEIKATNNLRDEIKNIVQARLKLQHELESKATNNLKNEIKNMHVVRREFSLQKKELFISSPEDLKQALEYVAEYFNYFAVNKEQSTKMNKYVKDFKETESQYQAALENFEEALKSFEEFGESKLTGEAKDMPKKVQLAKTLANKAYEEAQKIYERVELPAKADVGAADHDFPKPFVNEPPFELQIDSVNQSKF